MADNGQRTEKATQRRMDRARKEGNFPASREFVAACQFFACVVLAATFSGDVFAAAAHLTRRLLTAAFSLQLTGSSITNLFRDLAVNEFVPLAMWGAAPMLLVICAQLASTGLGVSFAKLAPDFKRLSFGRKLTSLPGQNLPAFLQALFMLPLVGAVLWYEVRDNLNSLLELSWLAPQSAAARVGQTLASLLWRAAAFFLIVGILDLLWQRHRHAKQLKMSKQDVRQEMKEQEGNPHVKQRIRRMQRDFARRNMMKEIPTATAIIVNPTHYAVAIRYSMESAAAPKVVAKGKNYLALRIRQRGIEHQVPIVENPPLAQALYASVDVGQEIPAHLYRAVAEILAYIYRLMNGRMPG